MAKGIFLTLTALLLLSACSSLNYYSQAVGGHVQVLLAARPIKDVVDDPQCDPELKKRLQEVREIREFATRELGLPDNDSYRSYADLKRPFVTWNVFAAPEFSLQPERWCMLVVGCVAYRGFYDKNSAEALASELRKQGLDTFIGGVPAYSTLGYFSDPVLNTFLRHGGTDVARLIFHELAHQVLYVEGDTVFNESFATSVENEGLRRWLAYKSKPELAQQIDWGNEKRAAFVDFVTGYRDKLRAIYASVMPEQSKREAKAALLDEMKSAYIEREGEGGSAPYQRWFETDLNNAKIASLGLYTQLVPVFDSLLRAEGNDLRRFYRRVNALAKLPERERQAQLRSLHLATGEPAKAS